LSENCIFTHADQPHSSTSISCKVPVYNYVDTSQTLTHDMHSVEGCSAALTDICCASTSFSCSVPKYENISSYWVFDMLLGNSAVVVLKDKSILKATYYCRARDGHGKRKPFPIDDLTRGRKRDDSLNEVLLLLEAGAMPSQYIEASPPRPPPLRKGRSRMQSHNVRGRKGPSSSSKDDTSSLHLEEELLASSATRSDIKPRQSGKSEQSCVPGSENKFERSSVTRSEGSDLSASPDRLVICEDEDIIVQDDPVQVIQNLQDTSHSVVSVLSETISPSTETLSSIVEKTNLAKQGTSGMAEVTPSRRSLRKRASEPIEAPVVRKRSVKGQGEIKSTLVVAEERRRVNEPKPAHPKLSIPEGSQATARDKVSRRMGRLSEASTATAAPPIVPAIPKP
ncbi:hypothetical protein ANCCAN_28829, partial [Ancylostoma caninum]